MRNDPQKHDIKIRYVSTFEPNVQSLETDPRIIARRALERFDEDRAYMGHRRTEIIDITVDGKTMTPEEIRP